MFNLLRSITGRFWRLGREEQVGLSRMSRPPRGERARQPEIDADKDAAMDTQQLWSDKQDLLSRAKNNKIGRSWQGNTLKGKHQRDSRTDFKRQEQRDRALQTGVWEIDTY